MIVGFTGTQQGMTDEQMGAVRALVREQATQARHGDCIGADAQFHRICIANGIPVVIHPPTDPKKRANCMGADLVMPEAPYLDRNHDIVNASDMLIATPKEAVEPEPARGQGTWSTVRYARKIGRRVLIIWPNGQGLLKGERLD